MIAVKTVSVAASRLLELTETYQVELADMNLLTFQIVTALLRAVIFTHFQFSVHCDYSHWARV